MDTLEFFTIHEVAAKLKLSRRQADRLVAQGKLPVRWVGGRKRFWGPDVLAAFPQSSATAEQSPIPVGPPPISLTEHLRRKAANWKVVPPDELARHRAKKKGES